MTTPPVVDAAALVGTTGMLAALIAVTLAVARRDGATSSDPA